MKKVLLFLIVFLPFVVHAQEKSSFSAEVGFSQTYKNFFQLYRGILGIGLEYDKQITGNLFGGLSLHLDYLRIKNTSARTIIYKPQVRLGYAVRLKSRFEIIPAVLAGYSLLNLANKEFSYTETQSGWNSGAELKLVWKTHHRTDYYLFGRYDYIWLSKDENFTMIENYRNIHLTGIGLGILIKPKTNEK